MLARRVGADGRTRAYLNGRAATVGELRDLGGALMSFYGQHEHRKLTIAAKQLGLLDELCGAEQSLRLRACAEAYAEVRRLQERLQELRELAGARERELDLLEFELAEIDSAAPDQQEYEELLARGGSYHRLHSLQFRNERATVRAWPEPRASIPGDRSTATPPARSKERAAPRR